jgi:hypothetical protein
VVLENFLADFVPQIFLRVQLGRIRPEQMQHDIVGDFEFIAMMIADTVHEQQDKLPAVLPGQSLEENLRAFRVGRRHDQIDASSVLWGDGATEVRIREQAGRRPVALSHWEPGTVAGC